METEEKLASWFRMPQCTGEHAYSISQLPAPHSILFQPIRGVYPTPELSLNQKQKITKRTHLQYFANAWR